jgi:hypothetical protein
MAKFTRRAHLTYYVMFNRAWSRELGKCMHALRHNVTMTKNRFYVNMFFTRRSLDSCAPLCVQTHSVYRAYFRFYGFRSLKWCNALCAQFFGFSIRTVSKRDTQNSFKKGHPSTRCKHRYTIKGTDLLSQNTTM